MKHLSIVFGLLILLFLAGYFSFQYSKIAEKKALIRLNETEVVNVSKDTFSDLEFDLLHKSFGGEDYIYNNAYQKYIFEFGNENNYEDLSMYFLNNCSFLGENLLKCSTSFQFDEGYEILENKDNQIKIKNNFNTKTFTLFQDNNSPTILLLKEKNEE